MQKRTTMHAHMHARTYTVIIGPTIKPMVLHYQVNLDAEAHTHTHALTQ